MSGFYGIPQVPAKNSTNNNNVADAVGNKTDEATAQAVTTGYPSLHSHAKLAYYHVHQPALVYPHLADAITVTASGTSWTYGAAQQIIATNAITSAFDIHWVVVHSISDVDDYQLALYADTGAGDVLIGEIAFNRLGNFDRSVNLPIQVPVEAANAKISAKLACKAADTHSVTIKLYVHTYPN